MKLINFFLILLTVNTLISCGGEDNVLNIPKKGSISGILLDTLGNDETIEGAEVVATFTRPNNDIGELDEKRILTNSLGEFYLSDLWDETRITVSKNGLKTVAFDIDLNVDKGNVYEVYMNGLPDIDKTSVSKDELNYTAGDTTIISVEVRDNFNSEDAFEDYEGTAILYNIVSSESIASYDFEVKVRGITYTNLQAIVPAKSLPKPDDFEIYGVIIEIRDPDKNLLQRELDEILFLNE